MKLLARYEQSYFVPTAERGKQFIGDNRKQEYGEIPAKIYSENNNNIVT